LRGRWRGKFEQADLPRIEHHSIRINLRLRIAALTACNAFRSSTRSRQERKHASAKQNGRLKQPPV
jgi:hypothetical protein